MTTLQKGLADSIDDADLSANEFPKSRDRINWREQTLLLQWGRTCDNISTERTILIMVERHPMYMSAGAFYFYNVSIRKGCSEEQPVNLHFRWE